MILCNMSTLPRSPPLWNRERQRGSKQVCRDLVRLSALQGCCSVEHQPHVAAICACYSSQRITDVILFADQPAKQGISNFPQAAWSIQPIRGLGDSTFQNCNKGLEGGRMQRTGRQHSASQRHICRARCAASSNGRTDGRR